MNSLINYIGTYTKGDSNGIYSLEISDNKLMSIKLCGQIENPTYLSKNNNFIYSISSKVINGELYGGVSSFLINDDYTLKLISSSHLKGKPPCHLCTTYNNKYLICANYHERRILSYSLNNGEIKECISEVTHSGHGVNPLRQEAPHIHFVSLSFDETKLYALDLGLDILMVYSFDNGVLSLLEDECVPFPAGCGPRHMVSDKINGLHYVLTELSGEIIVLLEKKNKLVIINKIPLVSTDFKGEILGAAIRLHPNNKFLYASERGENKIHLLHISKNTLTLKNSFSSKGDGPRDFNFSEDSNYLICGNQNTNNVVLYKICKDGSLIFNDESMVSSPVCIL